jgi:hypothetical protein
LICFSLILLFCGFPAMAQSQPPSVVQAPEKGVSPVQQAPDQESPGSISGTVVDPSGAAIAGARVRLIHEDQNLSQDLLADADGQFTFANIAPGNFQLTITAQSFTGQTFSGTLQPGEPFVVPRITLDLAPENAEVTVTVPRVEVAEAEVKEEEKQRVLDVIPNFYVTYRPDAVPLTSKQKFGLAWRTTIDPVTFVLAGGIAGIQQAQNHFPEYGQGAQGYAKRFGAAYADAVAGTFIGSAILPSILKQDPRYFYKGTGSIRFRFLYAIANSVITKGDNRHWQPNYSGILGSFAAGGVSNLYYPAQDRDGATLLFENTLIGIGSAAAANLLQEFLIRKLTPNALHRDPAKT